jgi:glycerol uptake facilitator-like aquaporin
MVVTARDWNKATFSACVAEAIGTFCIVFFGGWAYLWHEQKSTEFSWTAVALTQGLFNAFAVWGCQALSGGHFNWAVTLTLAGLRKLPFKVGAWYLLSQTIGSFVAAFLIGILVPDNLSQATYTGVGVPMLNKEYSESVGFFCEFIATGFYMYMVMAFNYDSRNSKNLYGIAAGGAMIAAIISIGPVTGGAINPARIIGPILISLTKNNKDFFNDLHTYWFFFLGPIFGALLVGFYYEFFMMVEEDQNPEQSVASYEKEDDFKKLKI